MKKSCLFELLFNLHPQRRWWKHTVKKSHQTMTDPNTLLCQNCSENGPTMVLSVQTFPSLLTSRSRQSSNKYLCLTPLDATNSEDSRKCSAPSLSALSTWLWLQVEEPQVRSNLPSKLCVKPLTWFTSLLVSTPFRYLSMQL